MRLYKAYEIPIALCVTIGRLVLNIALPKRVPSMIYYSKECILSYLWSLAVEVDVYIFKYLFLEKSNVFLFGK